MRNAQGRLPSAKRKRSPRSQRLRRGMRNGLVWLLHPALPGTLRSILGARPRVTVVVVLCCCKVVIQHLAPPPPLTLPVRPAGCVDVHAEAAPGDRGGLGLAGRADGDGVHG